MPELSAEGDTVMEGLTLFMIKPYFFSREVCLGGQQRMRRQVWEELLCSYSALHAKQREREWGSKQSKARFLQHSIYSHISPHYGWSSEDLHPEESEIIPHHLPRGYLYLCLCQHLTQLNNRWAVLPVYSATFKETSEPLLLHLLSSSPHNHQKKSILSTDVQVIEVSFPQSTNESVDQTLTWCQCF